MGSITVRETLRKCSALLQDNDPQFARHFEVDMVDAVNEAQRVIYTYLPSACSRIDAIRLKPGAVHDISAIPALDVKPGDGSTQDTPLVGSQLLVVLCNMGADGLTVGRAIRPLTDGREVLDTLEPMWQAQADATEVLHFLYDPTTPRQFMTYPAVPPGRLWVRASIVSQPKRIPNFGEPGYATYAASGTNAATLSVADDYEVDVMNYVCARMLMKNAQIARATGMSPADYATLFTGSINAKSQALLGFNPNLKRLPFAPDVPGAAS